VNYIKIYEDLIQSAKSKNRVKHTGIYYENHHIQPKCLEGTDAKNNLVLLTAKEHYVAHKLLTCIYPNNRKIGIAFHYMTFGKNYYNESSRDYEYARELASKLSKGVNHPFFGKTHSKETRKKLSEAGKGRKQSQETIRKRVEKCDLKREETKKKQSASLKGHNVSSETRKKISKSRKGIKFSEKHLENLSESHKGIKQTDKAKRKIGEASKIRMIGNTNSLGTKRSEETKQKMSESAKKRGISKETQEKMLEGRKNSTKIKGRKRSEETKQKMREAWIKRKQKEL